MPSTYTLISSNVLASSAASVTFSAIPSTYTDLVVRASLKATNTNTVTSAGYITFNGTGGTVYSRTDIQTLSNSNAPTSSRSSNGSEIQSLIIDSANAAFANTFNSTEIYIPSYTVSQNKPVSIYSVAEMNNTTGYDLMNATAGLWRNTSAITSITFYPQSASFEIGSSFYLYGIKNS